LKLTHLFEKKRIGKTVQPGKTVQKPGVLASLRSSLYE
jgi:hypothetical protein